jgi:GntP family gluconate:H+ symporter
MIGGGKAGNIISPNPNTIAAADAFKVELTDLMAANLIPAFFAFAAAAVLSAALASRLRRAGGDGASPVADAVSDVETPRLWCALAGPLTVIALLSLRPFAGIAVDPLIALPVGGAVSMLACGKRREMIAFSQYGLGKVSGVAILLIGTGTIAGIVKASELNVDMIALLQALKLPMFALAPVSGVIMAGATASTTAGATIASQTFATPLVEAGVAPVSAAAMIHAGSTVIDSLPHGSFFHATGGSVFMGVKERLKLIPYEAAVGLVATVTSCMCALV